MGAIPDITGTEEWIVTMTLEERYRQDIDLQYADTEPRPNPADRALASCPVFVWEAENYHFFIFKPGERRYRCQFLYRDYQQYGTDVHEYDDLTEGTYRCCRHRPATSPPGGATSTADHADRYVAVRHPTTRAHTLRTGENT